MPSSLVHAPVPSIPSGPDVSSQMLMFFMWISLRSGPKSAPSPSPLAPLVQARSKPWFSRGVLAVALHIRQSRTPSLPKHNPPNLIHQNPNRRLLPWLLLRPLTSSGFGPAHPPNWIHTALHARSKGPGHPIASLVNHLCHHPWPDERGQKAPLSLLSHEPRLRC